MTVCQRMNDVITALTLTPSKLGLFRGVLVDLAVLDVVLLVSVTSVTLTSAMLGLLAPLLHHVENGEAEQQGQHNEHKHATTSTTTRLYNNNNCATTLQHSTGIYVRNNHVKFRQYVISSLKTGSVATYTTAMIILEWSPW